MHLILLWLQQQFGDITISTLRSIRDDHQSYHIHKVHISLASIPTTILKPIYKLHILFLNQIV